MEVVSSSFSCQFDMDRSKWHLQDSISRDCHVDSSESLSKFQLPNPVQVPNVFFWAKVN